VDVQRGWRAPGRVQGREIPIHDTILEVLSISLEYLVRAFPEIKGDDDYEELATVRRGLDDKQYWPDF
jgi:hypothetical protein